MPETIADNITLVCPVCKNALERHDDIILCDECGRQFIQTRDEFINLLPEDKLQETDLKSWQTRQNVFLGWVKSVMDEAIVTSAKSLYDEFSAYIGDINGVALDVGCADGQMNSYLKQTRYIGIEPCEKWMLDKRPAYVEKLYPIDRNNIIFIRGFGEYLPFADGSIDNLIISNALDHSISPYNMLAEAARVLRPGGGLYLMHDNPSLASKVSRKSISEIYNMVIRRMTQFIFTGSIRTPHIKIRKADLDRWLKIGFIVESKPSGKGKHIFYRAVKRAS